MWPFKSKNKQDKSKGGFVPDTNTYTFVKFSKDTAETNPEMIIREYERLIGINDNKIQDIVGAEMNVSIFIPEEFLTPSKAVVSTGTSANDRSGSYVSLRNLRNAMFSNSNQMTYISEENRIDVIEFINNEGKRSEAIKELQKENENIKAELKAFKNEFYER